MNVIISGGRKFENYKLLKLSCDRILKSFRDVTVFSGGAKGADTAAKLYARERNYKLKLFPALWDDLSGKDAIIKTNASGNLYNALAGINRNVKMAEGAEMLIAFWDGVSPGTKNMIHEAEKRSLTVYIIKYA